MSGDRAVSSSGPQLQPQDSLTVDIAGAAQLLGISESHLYQMRATGHFGPTPIRLGRCVRFLVSEIVEWVHAGCPPRARWLVTRDKSRPTTRA
jgi:predicted DNA-binding transcriptional regulator AlpA